MGPRVVLLLLAVLVQLLDGLPSVPTAGLGLLSNYPLAARVDVSGGGHVYAATVATLG